MCGLSVQFLATNNTIADLIKCGQIKLLNLQGAAWECTDPGQLWQSSNSQVTRKSPLRQERPIKCGLGNWSNDRSLSAALEFKKFRKCGSGDSINKKRGPQNEKNKKCGSGKRSSKKLCLLNWRNIADGSWKRFSKNQCYRRVFPKIKLEVYVSTLKQSYTLFVVI